jgi:hypothetical protein
MADIKDQFVPLITSVLAQSSRRHSVAQVRPEHKIKDLGLDSVAIADVKTKLFRMVGGPKYKGFPAFQKALRITPASTVRQVANSFAKHPLVTGTSLRAAASLPGKETTETKGVVGTAVRAVLSQASAHPYSKIKPEIKLKRLGVDAIGIADLKTGIFKTFSGSKYPLDFEEFSTALNVSPESTVIQVIQSSANALERYKKQRPAGKKAEAKPPNAAGDDTTPSKGDEFEEPEGDDTTDVKG